MRDIWDPNRAILDDEAVGGNNRNEPRDAVAYVDAKFQASFDAIHLLERRWQAKYPERGMPPSDSPEWDDLYKIKTTIPEVEGKIAFKAAF